MTFPFVKLHGAKNDFLLTPSEKVPSVGLDSIAIAICNRYTGIGADGWMLIDRTAAADYDASIRLFNSDGSEPELSGNGTRCAAALLARDHPDRRDFRIKTGAGIKHLSLIETVGPEYRFEMNMGKVQVTELNALVQGRDAVIVDVGNPQCALPVNGFDFSMARGRRFDRAGPAFSQPNQRFLLPPRRSSHHRRPFLGTRGRRNQQLGHRIHWRRHRRACPRPG